MNTPTWVARALWAAIAGIGLLLAVAVLLVPYHLWDALSFGSWSVGISQGVSLSDDPEFAVYRQRPLFYWLQGGVWAVLGVDERAGRLLAAGFFVLLATSLWLLAGRGDRTAVRAPLALALLLLSPEAISLAASGLSDVPAAAMVAATGVLALSPGPLTWRRQVLLALLAAATGLAKPSVFPALAGLGLAALLAPPGERRGRVRERLAPLTAGVAVAVAYLVWQSRLVGLSLAGLLNAGNGGELVHSRSRCDGGDCESVGQLASRVRLGSALELLWMGPFLRPFLAFALVYTALRLLGRSGRWTVGAAAGAALVIPWLGSVVSSGALLSGPFGSPAALAYALPCSALLALGALAPDGSHPSRRDLGRIAVWALPSIAVWLFLAPFNPRLLAPGWPALVTLMALAAAPALAAAAARGRIPALAAVALLLGGLALNVRDLDALGAIAPRPGGSLAVIADVVRDPLMGQERARAVAEPELAGELAALRPLLRGGGRLVTQDGRMRFFFHGRVTIRRTPVCSDLAGHAAFLLLTNPVSLSVLQPETRDPRWWVRNCPGTRLVAELPGRYAVFSARPGSPVSRAR